MPFMSPHLLWILLLLPLLPLVYAAILRRRRQHAVRFANLGLVKDAQAGRIGYRRHVPPALLFLAVALMVLALARPTAVLTLPSERSVVILAIDVSGSMRAADIEPTRMAVAKSAAKKFVSEQPRTTRIGVVAFSTSAMTTQEPTIAHADVLDAIDALTPQRFTAVGSGIVASLQSIFPDADIDLSDLDMVRRMPESAPLGQLSVKKPTDRREPVAPGSYTSAVIVLLSDGKTNVGIEPLDAARLAADRGVRVFTVGFGTPEGGIVDFGGGYMRTQLDEATLKAVAEMTGAKYFHARNETDLTKAYETLTAQFVAETKRTEVSALAAIPALILLLIAGTLSVLWFNRGV